MRLPRRVPAVPVPAVPALLCVLVGVLLAGFLAADPLSPDPRPARPPGGGTVDVWLTTTSGPGGRDVVKGLERQRPLRFTGRAAGRGAITVDASRTYQEFAGGGASFTDTAAWLLNSSGALSDRKREEVMRRLFSPDDGIGLSFLRNPMGASDLARFGYTYDDLPAGRTDPGLSRFSIKHDLADVLPLTRRARELNPALTVMASPWTAPAWMKDNKRLDQGHLAARYYGTYARYFVKYLQAYRAHGVPVGYVSAQNEPTCCRGYPSMRWSGSGLHYFTKRELLPRLRAAGLPTKVLALDWNWDRYESHGAPVVADPAVRAHPNFGGIAWHGYSGDARTQSAVHDAHPGVDAFDTELSGGDWTADQHRSDMRGLIDATRNWGRSWVKWSLAVDQDGGPHHGGCGSCTGLVTVHNGDRRHGEADFTVEYYTMGHLTKFVRPGASRIASTADSAVPNVAWRNPDGSRALIAYNDTGRARTIEVGADGRSFRYELPAGASATFTWRGD
ncbi:glycoside hydrolase family 30 protein [Streptomyces sp. P1-3]|uniref:glycoside hydrolase family 30 protein n=1 Tax=Streptomyces sp. P1-3 TaxID=3421658 RepID=UPI003D35E858